MNAKVSGTDAPDEVCALLTGVAVNLPHLHPDGRPVADATTSTDYSMTIPVRSPADDVAAPSTLQRWLWYAARRAGLHLDAIEDDYSTLARRVAAVRKIAPVLRVSSSDLEGLLPHVSVTRFGSEEVMQKGGDVPSGMSFVVNGRVRLASPARMARSSR